MVKAKRGKKAAKDGSDDSDVDQIDEVAENIASLSLKAGSAKTKAKKNAGQRAGFEMLAGESGDESGSDDDEEAPTKPAAKGKSSKKVPDDGEGSGEDEPPSKGGKGKAGKKGKKNVARDDSDNSDSDLSKAKPAEEAKAGKKAKRKKKKDESDEDIEKILAELQMEYSGVKSSSMEPEEKAEVKLPSEEKAAEGEEAGDTSSAVKTAAQKKREKKERERLKKQAQKQGGKAAEGDATEDTTETPKPAKAEPSKPAKAEPSKPAKAEPSKPAMAETSKPAKSETSKPAEAEKATKVAPVDEAEKPDVEPEEDGGKKKKKGKKEAEVKEDKKAPKKNKMIAAIQEAQRKIQEEEERLRKEAEEEEARLAAQEAARLEAERLELERKERKKKKEKERKERLKAEGKLLTPKQKADRARAQAMLDALGVAPPQAGEKKVRPGTRVRPSKMRQQSQQQQGEDASADSESRESSEPPRTESEQQQLQPAEETVEEIKDSWDAESDTEPEPGKVEATPAPAVEPSKERAPEAKNAEVAASDESSSEESGSEDEADSSSEESDDQEGLEHLSEHERKRAKALARIAKRREDAEKKRSPENLRAAVICVLGHVDTGKTKILDKLRRTSVQAGEAGGITQQIGATNVPMDAIKEQTRIVRGFADVALKLPGLLIIDTPGHASFSNLRSRGSSLCDMAILVVDIMHGLEEQTLESINLLKSKKTPFIVALNKIDRLYDWTTMARKDIRDVIKSQATNTQTEFDRRTKDVVLQFAEQGLNAALFYENPDPRSYVSLVPTSAITGEGMGNLLALIVENCQTMLTRRLMYSEELQATVLEVKAITGLGTTIDCILVNGRLREGDTIVLASSDGNAIVTQVRSLLMPQPMKELRVKNEYIEYKEVMAAQGVKIAAKDLEKAIAGLNMLVAHHPDEVDVCREEVVRDLARELGRIKLQQSGVLVQASTLGSLEALLEFLKDSKIPYSSVKIGPVVKKDVMRASSMLERDSQYGTILAFDVRVERDAQEMADTLGVKIFQADIIYHLFDQFTAHREQLRQSKRQQFKNIAVFPCKLRILPQYVFNSRDPIVAGVIVEDGIVCVGTPVCVPNKESTESAQFIDLGVVSSIESNHKSVESARRGQEVCIKIEHTGESGAPKMFGRHFDEKDIVISKISRQSIDACKEYFREDLLKSDWQLMVELKKVFQIL